MFYLPFNPTATADVLRSFGVQSDDCVQSIALGDPANHFSLSSGMVTATETKPLQDGLLVARLLPGNQSNPRSSAIYHAVSVAELEDFTVSNQTHNGLTILQSSVPLCVPDMSVSFYRLGSSMHVPLETSVQVAALTTSGASVKTALAWGFVNSQIITAAVAGFTGADIAITALIYVSDVAATTTASTHELTAGQYVEVSSATPSAYNDIIAMLFVSSITTFTCTSATASSGTTTTQGTIGAVTLSDITLPVKVLVVEIGNSRTVTYDNSTGFLTWNNNDSCALVLL